MGGQRGRTAPQARVQVWVLYPDQQELHQHVRGESTVHIYGVSDTRTIASLLPGLSIAAGGLFAVPDLTL